jgi:hypothetical protein
VGGGGGEGVDVQHLHRLAAPGREVLQIHPSLRPVAVGLEVGPQRPGVEDQSPL